MADLWDERKKFEKSGEYILNDWTGYALVLTLTNSIGEKFKWNFEPEADASSIPTRPTNDDTVLNMYLPLLDSYHVQATPLPHRKGKVSQRKGNLQSNE